MAQNDEDQTAMHSGIHQLMPHIRSQDGTVIAYRTIGGGQPLLLVHGTSVMARRWMPLLRGLAETFNVCEMDRRGYGDSGDAAAYSIESDIADVSACLAALARRAVNVVGHSYGAICALEAARRTRQVGRLVLYEPPIASSPAAYCPPGLISAMRERIACHDNDGAVTMFAHDVLQISPEELAVMKKLAMWADVSKGAQIVLRELESASQYRLRSENFRDWTVPTLILTGGDSPSHYRATAEALRAVLPGSRVEVLPGQQHLAMTTAPALIARSITDFLSPETPAPRN
jgi:pimeloyl-ACP methyl ester carboxylesterase